ncbi:MAG: hypothetical protein INR71_14880, partial [Terriglobus roseus]|nr:hypothetical protein [Terriglobus roseus]
WSYFYRGDTNPQARGLRALFEQTRFYIKAINPALNVKVYKTAIINAIVRRGVQVDLILSYHMNKTRQHYLMGGDNADMAAEVYGALLAKGGQAAADRLRIYWGTSEDGSIAPAHHPSNIHAKIASFDGDALLVGSTNWDWPSYNSARELSVALFGSDVSLRFEQEVFAPRREQSRRIQAQDLPWRARQPGHPVYDYLHTRH